MTSKPATPAEAEELAKKAVGDYLTACRIASREDREAMVNYLMKLASVAERAAAAIAAIDVMQRAAQQAAESESPNAKFQPTRPRGDSQ